MPPVCTVGDIGVGVCPAHYPSPIPFVTNFSQGVPTVNANGQNIITIGGSGNASCGHNTIALSGSSTVMAGGMGVHRLGDSGIGSGGGAYTVTSGQPNVNAGG